MEVFELNHDRSTNERLPGRRPTNTSVYAIVHGFCLLMLGSSLRSLVALYEDRPIALCFVLYTKDSPETTGNKDAHEKL